MSFPDPDWQTSRPDAFAVWNAYLASADYSRHERVALLCQQRLADGDATILELSRRTRQPVGDVQAALLILAHEGVARRNAIDKGRAVWGLVV